MKSHLFKVGDSFKDDDIDLNVDSQATSPIKSHLFKVGNSFKDDVVDFSSSIEDSQATKCVDSLQYLGVHIISSGCLKFDTFVL